MIGCRIILMISKQLRETIIKYAEYYCTCNRHIEKALYNTYTVNYTMFLSNQCEFSSLNPHILSFCKHLQVTCDRLSYAKLLKNSLQWKNFLHRVLCVCVLLIVCLK